MALRDAEKCRNQLDRISSALPETTQRPGGEKGLHTAYVVRKKTFAYFTVDHHGDGRFALTFRALPGEQAVLVASAPDRFFVPPYLGHLGWVGLWLDVAVDWSEVAEFMIEAFRLAAPKRLDRATKHAESDSAASRMGTAGQVEVIQIGVLPLRPTNGGGAG